MKEIKPKKSKLIQIDRKLFEFYKELAEKYIEEHKYDHLKERW